MTMNIKFVLILHPAPAHPIPRPPVHLHPLLHVRQLPARLRLRQQVINSPSTLMFDVHRSRDFKVRKFYSEDLKSLYYGETECAV